MEKKNGTENNIEFNYEDSERFILNNRFKIIRSIGQGGMGEIFLAEDLKLRRLVAIKSIKNDSVSDPESRTRFLREAQTASQLEHMNICPIYEIYEEEKEHYIVMQYIDGVTIDTIIKYKELGIKKIIDIGIQICDGMNEAHQKGIIHRDLKPGNIIIDKKGVVKILDFGLAKFRDSSLSEKTGVVNSNLTEKGIVMGTVSYMSPEQARGEDLDYRSDLFSFGILMFELIEGINPFYDKEQINTLYNVLNKEVKFSGKTDPGLSKIITKLLDKKKSERYSDFLTVKEGLTEFQNEISDRKGSEHTDGATEIIDLSEKREIMDEIRRTSDIEDLGELVYKIKQIKAKTLPVVTTGRNYFKKISVFFTLILMLFSIYLFFKNKGNLSFRGETGIFFINVNELKGDVPDDIRDGINFLIRESLDQFDEFDTISPKTIVSISRSAENNPDLREIKRTNRIYYDLKGSLSRIKNIYNFDIVLSSVNNKKNYSITIPGLESKNSILEHQIDTLSRRIYTKIFPDRKNTQQIKPISGIYGSNWDDFESFFRGLGYFKKYDNLKAERYFSGDNESPASKYYLAKIFYFRGSRTLAKKKLDEITPFLNDLTESIKLKVLALNARLEFNFTEEINYLKKLKERNIKSKTVFFELGEAYFHHGNAKMASMYYSEALTLDSEFSNAINHLGYCNSYLGYHSRAIELFEEYRNLDNSANSFDSLGDGYFFSGELISAEASKKAAVNKDSKGVFWAHLTISDIAFLKARFKDAQSSIENYMKVANSDKNIGDAYSKMAFIEYSKGNSIKALTIINRSLDKYDSSNINGNSAEARWIRGLILLSMGRVKESSKDLQWLQEMVENYNLNMENFSSPYKFFLHLNALSLEKEGKLIEAGNNFIELLKMRSQLCYWITMFHYQFFQTEYAYFLLRNNNYNESEREIDKCLEYSADYIPALWLKARLREREDEDIALNYYLKIDSLYGGDKEKNLFTETLRKKIMIK